MPGLHVAIVLPDGAPNLAAIEGLDHLLAWATAQGKDVTLVGGSEQARAEAVVAGLRVSTSVAAWEAWEAATQQASARLEEHLQAQGEDSGWRIIHPTHTAQAIEDDLPAYLATLSPDGDPVVALPPRGESTPADERYEDAVIALIWQTGKLSGEIDAAQLG